jgi:hypothetical protein
LLRHLGFAARFVSGYLIQLKPDLVSLDGPSGTDQSISPTCTPGRGLSPRRRLDRPRPDLGPLTGESHIPLAATPHYRNAAPISGMAMPSRPRSISVRHAVDRVAEHPRITKPFSDELGRAERAGPQGRRGADAGDVRLTMGGEPTFVSIDDFESGEWNTDAVGPTKRDLADQLIRRLRDRFAPGGFLHYGQGKWYPGESLPRWTFSLYWRATASRSGATPR